MRVGCWKLVCVVATPACCYGNRQISFQGQAGGPWHSSGTPGGGGWDGNTEFVLVSALPSLPAGLWDTCCYLWAVGVSWKSSQRAALLRAGKLLKPLSRAEKFIHAWISAEGLLLLPKSQAQLCRLWDPLEMPCGQCTAPGSCLPSVRRQELQTGHWSGKQGTGAATRALVQVILGIPHVPESCEPKGMAGLGDARMLCTAPGCGGGTGAGILQAGSREEDAPVRIPLKCKECSLGLLYGSCSLIPQCWSCHGMHNGCLCPHTPTPQPGCFLDANTSPSFPSTPASVTVRD